MSAEQEGKPPGLGLALIFLLNSPELVYFPSTFQLLHGTLHCTPSSKSCAFTPLACQLTLPLRNTNNRKPEHVESMAWCLLGGIFPIWCHCYAGLCPPPQHNPDLDKLPSSSRWVGRAQLAPLLHGKQAHCRVGCCFTAEVCHVWHNLTDTKLNKSRSGSRRSSSCCVGWDCQLRSFWTQKQVCVPANKRGMGFLGVKANLLLTQWNVLVLETTYKRV